MVSQKYRWDFIGLSTDTKPTSETSDKVVNGSTYYCSDTSKLYVYCNGTWYERKPLGGGGGGGGTSDFNDLSNRPKYNGSDMTGSTNIPEVKTYTAGSNVAISDQNVISATDTTYTAGTNVSISDQNVISATDTTYSAFTGTDGTAAGTAGLVPAPATTDAGKFLKADGTWDTAGGGGGFTELTSADYNYPTNNPTSIALWLLDEGTYSVDGNGNFISVKMNSGRTDSVLSGLYEISNYTESGQTRKQIEGFYNDNGTLRARLEQVAANGTYVLGINLVAPNISQSTGTSTTNVMSQNATTSMVFADPSTKEKIQIGNGALAQSVYSLAIGKDAIGRAQNSIAIGNGASTGGALVGEMAIGASASATGQHSLALGTLASASGKGSLAVGSFSSATVQGQMDIGTYETAFGYNSSNYRLLSGLYDPQSAHDAATKGYVDPTTDASAPTTATVGRLGQIQIDTTNNDAYMCVAVDTVTPSYTWKKITA